MSILILSIALIILALLTLLASLKALLASGWLLKWLRGSGGIILLLFAVTATLIGYELLTFLKADEGQVIATLTFDKMGEQDFEVELVNSEGKRKNYRILGDQWQLDVKLVALEGLGQVGRPSYKLDRLSGRYLSLEQEKQDTRSVYALGEKKGLDLWSRVLANDLIPMLRAKYGSAAFMPMENGAIYQVKLFKKGLLAEPVNEQARQAIGNW
ncbi:MAG: hypothetical protein ACJA0E_001689 [Bermanella sp.]|jgi:hypothetical protein